MEVDYESLGIEQKSDARFMFPFAEERFYKYFYDKGVLNTSFIPPESAKHRAVVFRSAKTEGGLKQRLIEIRDDFNYRGVEIDMELVRSLLNHIYFEMKESAEQELFDIQNCPAGVSIHRIVTAFTPPAGYDLDVGDAFTAVASSYPYCFGALARKTKGARSVHFFCQATAICRSKGVVLPMSSTDMKKNMDDVLYHVRMMHWQQLLQNGHV